MVMTRKDSAVGKQLSFNPREILDKCSIDGIEELYYELTRELSANHRSNADRERSRRSSSYTHKWRKLRDKTGPTRNTVTQKGGVMYAINAWAMVKAKVGSERERADKARETVKIANI